MAVTRMDISSTGNLSNINAKYIDLFAGHGI